MNHLLQYIPHKKPFRFVDEITFVDDNRIEGYHVLDPDYDFYKGHFPNYPVTPGVILIEIMAQIGLVAFGLHLLKIDQGNYNSIHGKIPVLSSTNVVFKRSVFPNQTIYVKAEKKLFRHGKLICDVILQDEEKRTISKGTISGFVNLSL